MVKMEKGTNKGGILADDMGLGKTVQSLACCILHRTPADPTASEATITLIVAPTSLLYQWADEIKYKVHEGLLRVRIYYGKHKRGTSVRELAESADVVLTTYTTLALEHAEKRRNPLFQMHWLRVILDEAHTIKNRDTLAAHACTDLMADYRWCLSGTPIQNKVSELYSLIRFLKIQPYCDWDKFRKDIEAPLKKNERSGIKRVQALLQSVCLRRTKNSTLDGRNIIVLPSKTVHVIEVDFSSAERAFYSNLEEQSIQKFNKYLADGAVMKNYSNVLVLLLRLRQACCHLSLTGLSQESNRDSPGIPTVSATVALELMDPAVLRRLRDLRLASLGVCPVCADAFEAGKVAIPCGCVACGECVALVGGDGRGEEGGCPGCHGEVCPGFVESGELAEGLDRDVDVGCASKLDDLDAGVSELEDLKADLGKSERLYHFMNAIEGIAGNVKVLQSIRTNSPNDKTIVFTQFCGMMTLCEPHLAYSGFSFVRYDGSMSADQRSRAVQQLQEDPDTLVMLVSLKCGSLGLNLTCANHVIILDFWWNMAVENQAVDRVHRLGQMKEVSVHRITIRDTVEERILEMQRKKQELFNAALGEGGFEGLSASKLGLKELIRLFTRN
ncbi:SNF2 family N-terminal domain-containing protein [Chytriomyces sp. MP71]|nr:SNF2 family N-terminal domain-containing protein [Chytriomyces sp. MP71]